MSSANEKSLLPRHLTLALSRRLPYMATLSLSRRLPRPEPPPSLYGRCASWTSCTSSARSTTRSSAAWSTAATCTYGGGHIYIRLDTCQVRRLASWKNEGKAQLLQDAAAACDKAAAQVMERRKSLKEKMQEKQERADLLSSQEKIKLQVRRD